MASATQRLTRRQEYALATRQAIVDAARRLFAERGYFAATVEDIAREARVAPATIYAVTGGKSGLLSELIGLWTSDPIVDRTVRAINDATDPVAIICEVASASRAMREAWADVIRIMLTTAPHDASVAELQRKATSIYRGALVPVAERLAKLRALRSGLDPEGAVELLWFYFGYASYFTLHDDNGWSYARAEAWLAEQACRELLASRSLKAATSPAPGRRTSRARLAG